MLRILFVLLTTIVALGAEDPWAKVREIKSGTELRIYKKNARQPVLAKMADATDESLIVVVKNEQTAISKDQIDRIDYRPPQRGSRVTRETKSTTETTGAAQGSSGTSNSTSSSVNIGSKPEFETIYRRTPAPQK